MKFVYILILLTSVFTKLAIAGEPTASVLLTEFGTFEGKPVSIYTMTNQQGMVAKISDYGGVVVSLQVPDRNGNFEDVVLGYDNFPAYKSDSGWYGAIAGRNANRIKAGKFSIDGKQYQLALNNGPNNLHGGVKGFNKQLWKGTPSVVDGEPKLKLQYVSPDGEEGFPGNLSVTTTYTLTKDNSLKIEYQATTDQPTLCNLTHHSYWNIAGPNSKSILDQQVQLFCDKYNPTDETGIPTGESAMVAGTPFDFRTSKTIKQDIGVEHEQLKIGKGYDHNFVVNGQQGKLRPAAKVYDRASGRVMEVLTTDYGVQFYSGNWFDGSVSGRTGKFEYRTALCLECQHLPDSVNQPNFKSAVLRPGETYNKTTVYRFSVDGPATHTNTLDNLRRQIKAMHSLLEKNDLQSSENFVRDYAAPKDLAYFIEEKGGIKELAKSFHETKRELSIQALNATKEIQPEIDEAGTTYTFRLPKGQGPSSIKFLWRNETKRFHIKN